MLRTLLSRLSPALTLLVATTLYVVIAFSIFVAMRVEGGFAAASFTLAHDANDLLTGRAIGFIILILAVVLIWAVALALILFKLFYARVSDRQWYVAGGGLAAAALFAVMPTQMAAIYVQTSNGVQWLIALVFLLAYFALSSYLIFEWVRYEQVRTKKR